jgi:hypothetical protein
MYIKMDNVDNRSSPLVSWEVDIDVDNRYIASIYNRYIIDNGSSRPLACWEVQTRIVQSNVIFAMIFQGWPGHACQVLLAT